MIKLFLGAILVLALIGGAIRFASDEHSWQIIIHKQEALHSVQNGAIRIFNQFKKIISDSDISDTSSIVIEEG